MPGQRRTECLSWGLWWCDVAMVAKVHDVPLDHALYDQNWVFNLVKTLHAWLQLWFIFMFPPPCCGTLSLRLWWLTMVFCETSVTRDTTNELWWRFYANIPLRESCCWETCSKTGLLMMVIIITQPVATLIWQLWPLPMKVCRNLLAVCLAQSILLVSECSS